MAEEKRKIEKFTVQPPKSPLEGKEGWDAKMRDDNYAYDHCMYLLDNYFKGNYTDRTAEVVYLRAKLAVERLANHFGLEVKEVEDESICSDDDCPSS